MEKVESDHGKCNRIWVMDRGNVSAANLAFLRGRGGRYIVGTPKAMVSKVRGEVAAADGWREIRPGIKVKALSRGQAVDAAGDAPGEADETFVLCRSEDRVAKEAAMLDRFVRRMEAGLEAMGRSAAKGRLKDPAVAHERLGRLKDKNWRAAACFAVAVDRREDGTLSITWRKDERAKRELCGCYLLRTNVAETDPVKLWRQYVQLVDAEWAFRITKDELELRPIWHQNEARVQAHILVCFIAYAMWKTMGGWMQASGLGDSPRELLEEMRTIKTGDVYLPTRDREGRPGETLVIRCVTRPDDHVTVLLNRLGIELPNHLKRYRLPAASGIAKACVM